CRQSRPPRRGSFQESKPGWDWGRHRWPIFCGLHRRRHAPGGRPPSSCRTLLCLLLQFSLSGPLTPCHRPIDQFLGPTTRTVTVTGAASSNRSWAMSPVRFAEVPSTSRADAPVVAMAAAIASAVAELLEIRCARRFTSTSPGIELTLFTYLSAKGRPEKGEPPV